MDNSAIIPKETFITSVRVPENEHVTAPDKKVEEDGPAGMRSVRIIHEKVHQAIDCLSEKMRSALERQEQDFLAAYRAHMYKVQKEMNEMNEKLQNTEKIENKSLRGKVIEEERDWFRKEALRLDDLVTNLSKELRTLKEKCLCIEDDRKWLEKQLKTCKKQNKMLRAELDVRLTSTSYNAPSNGYARGLLNLSPTHDKALGPLVKPYWKPIEMSKPAQNQSLQMSRTSPISKEKKVKPEIAAMNRDIDLVAVLKRELDQKNREAAILRQQKEQSEMDSTCILVQEEKIAVHVTESDREMKGMNTESTLKKFFLQCIESVRKDRSLCQPLAEVKPYNQFSTLGKDIAAFSSEERIRVISEFLCHDKAVNLFCELIFSSHTQSDSALDMIAPSLDTASDTNNCRPAGSGAAVASAARSKGLCLSESTRNYLNVPKDVT